MEVLHLWNVLRPFKDLAIQLLFLAESKGALKYKLQWVFAYTFMQESIGIAGSAQHLTPWTCPSLRRQELSCSPAAWILSVLQLVCQQCMLMLIFHSLALWVICPFFLEFSGGGRHLFEAIAYNVKLSDKGKFDMLFIKSGLFVFFFSTLSTCSVPTSVPGPAVRDMVNIPPSPQRVPYPKGLPKVQFSMASV